MTMKIEQANKERDELSAKKKKEEKKFDHFISRACHENKILFILKFSEADSEVRKKFWNEKEANKLIS